MAHGSSPLFFSRLLRLEFPGSEAIRQLWRVAPPFVAAVFSREGMLAREGRVLIRGKFRRLLIYSVPALARHLGAHYGLQGGCNNCGASCNLLFRCPYWDTDVSHYAHRPAGPGPVNTAHSLRFPLRCRKKDTRPLLVSPEVAVNQ
jgi:hypothetical protein